MIKHLGYSVLLIVSSSVYLAADAETGMAGIGGMGGGLKGVGGMGGGFKGIGGMGGFKGIGGMGGCRGLGDAGGGFDSARQNFEDKRYTRYGDTDPSAKFGQFGQTSSTEGGGEYGSRWNRSAAYEHAESPGTRQYTASPLHSLLPIAVRQRELDMAGSSASSVNNPQWQRSEYAARQLAQDVGNVFHQMSVGVMSGFRGPHPAVSSVPYNNLGLLPSRYTPTTPRFTGNPDSMGGFHMYYGE